MARTKPPRRSANISTLKAPPTVARMPSESEDDDHDGSMDRYFASAVDRNFNSGRTVNSNTNKSHN